MQYGNGSETSYDYEPETFRLKQLKTTRNSDGAVLQGLNYTYDPVGNITAMPHLPQMNWDFKDQLSATTGMAKNDNPPPGKVPATTYYVYDAAGQRLRKITEMQNGARKDERIYLGGFELYRKYNGNGQTVALERETLHIMDDKQRIALMETRTQGNDPAPQQLIRYQFGNHLGSASLELDDQAQIISYEEYTPYGSTAPDRDTEALPLHWQGAG